MCPRKEMIWKKKRDKMKEKEEIPEEVAESQEATSADASETDEVTAEDVDLSSEEDNARNEVEELRSQLEKEKKKEYMFPWPSLTISANVRSERETELIKNAAESAFKGLLPIVDDFERALS